MNKDKSVYKIRVLCNADLPLLELLASVAETEGFDFVHRAVDAWRSGKNRFDRPGEALIGVFKSDSCIAVGGVNIDPYTENPRVGRVRHLYVIPEQRRSGIAQIILYRILERARENFEVLRLFTDNPDAAYLYESVGFRAIPDKRQSHSIVLHANAENEAISIREIESADRDFLFEMLYQSIYTAPGVDRPGREVLQLPKIRRYVENWGRVGDYALVAEDDSGVTVERRIGAIWLRFFPAKYPGYGFIDETIPEIGIAVVPGMRGKGIGSALLKALLERPDSSYPAISLSVDLANPAVKLYRHFGFIECAISGTSIVMRYDLK